MQHSIEAYFLMNFVLDSALIAIVARANECLNLRRTLLCGLLAAFYSLLTKAISPRLAHPAIQLILLIPIGVIACGDPQPRRWATISFQLACGSLMMGGIGFLLPSAGYSGIPLLVSAFGGGLLLLCLLLSARTSRLTTWEVTVCLQLRGRSVSFRALIDTGNRLREPISGLPVLIAEENLLHNLLPSLGEKTFPGRNISFGALGGSGTIRCFHPDLVLIRRGNTLIQAPDVWVAIYPGKIPGSSRALAPPSFAIIPGKT